MVEQHQDRITCQHKFPSKTIETEKPGFNVKVQQSALVRTCEAKRTV